MSGMIKQRFMIDIIKQNPVQHRQVGLHCVGTKYYAEEEYGGDKINPFLNYK